MGLITQISAALKPEFLVNDIVLPSAAWREHYTQLRQTEECWLLALPELKYLHPSIDKLQISKGL